MSRKDICVVAEVKTQSPFGFVSRHSWDELFEIAKNIGDIVSIHTDPRWGGSFELIKKARSLTDKPILAKGIHESDDDIKTAIKAGAKYVLVVGRLPKVYQDRCWIEPKSLSELSSIPDAYRVVWNERNIETGKRKNESFAQARATWKGWLCQASFIKTIDDIHPRANAAIIGTHLVKFAKSFKSTKSDQRKQSLYFSEHMSEEMRSEATRLGKPISWVIQKAWIMARNRIKRMS